MSLTYTKPSNYKATYHPELVQDLKQMMENSKGKKQIADARPSGR
jgi:uncharacterized protein (DUF362 family)